MRDNRDSFEVETTAFQRMQDSRSTASVAVRVSDPCYLCFHLPIPFLSSIDQDLRMIHSIKPHLPRLRDRLVSQKRISKQILQSLM